MKTRVGKLTVGALLALGIGGVMVGCDSGPKGQAADAIQTMPADAKADYEKQMKDAMQSGKVPTNKTTGTGAAAPK